MSFVSKFIAPWCKKYMNQNDGGYDHPPTTYTEGNVCNANIDVVSFVPVVSMEGDDDDDDGGYDYAPAA
ncbi:hypothetical protein VNO78_25264 [Psophocarpus tetragonolobus]|uniref:Uncharacterized protein n=1 Tax=Psophocarpus tetragonolobus TaxID=3891 RepID=A0AAN9XF86_PSOTE